MGNTCSSIGCSENYQSFTKEKEKREPVNDPNYSLHNRGPKTQMYSLHNKYINSNPTLNVNEKNNLNGNRVLMYVKELPTKVVQEKIKHQQQTNENFLIYPNRISYLDYQDDFQCNNFIKSKSDFERVFENERKLFSRSLVGKSNLNNKNNILDPSSNIRKNFRKSNHLMHEKSNNNKNNNNDIIFIYGGKEKSKSKGNDCNDEELLEGDTKLVFQKRVDNNKDSNLQLHNKDTFLHISEDEKNELDNVKSPFHKVPMSSKDSEEKEDLNIFDTRNKKDKIPFKHFLNLRYETNKPVDKIHNNVRKKIVLKEEFDKDKKITGDKDSKLHDDVKISNLNLEILKHEKRKRADIDTSIEYGNCSIVENPNIQSFFLKNKNFDKPDDILLSCENSLVDDKEKSILNINLVKKSTKNKLQINDSENKEKILNNPNNRKNHRNMSKLNAKGLILKQEEKKIIKRVYSVRDRNNDLAIAVGTINNNDLNNNNNNIQTIKCMNTNDSKEGRDSVQTTEMKEKEPNNDNKANNKIVKGRSSSFSRKIKEKLSNKPVWTINPKIFEDEKLMEFIRDPFFIHQN